MLPFADLRASAWKYAAIGCAVLAVAAIVTCVIFQARGAASDLRADAASKRAEAVSDELRQAREVIATERRKAAEFALIADQYEKERTDAIAQGNAVAADLRAGNKRLRDLSQGCKARVPGPAADPGVADAEDGLRADSVGRIVGAVAACQAERDALLNVAEEDRK